jgi:ABC-type nitrate/sulfonate/bicarbonate transport system substrate-binding protein
MTEVEDLLKKLVEAQEKSNTLQENAAKDSEKNKYDMYIGLAAAVAIFCAASMITFGTATNESWINTPSSILYGVASLLAFGLTGYLLRLKSKIK